MDPVTRASRAFLAEADAFFRAGKGPVLPMIAAASARPDLVKTLRLAELALANRRPLFLYEEPFTAARAWGDGLAAAITEDYEAVRGGAEKEGVTLPPFLAAEEGPSENGSPLARAGFAIERAAALLAERFDGVLVAILPAQVEDARAYSDAIATLAVTRFSPRVRLAVHHPPGGPLGGMFGDDGAHFHVDPDELAEHLKQLGGGRESAGPRVAPPPALTEEQRRAFEAETGRKLPSPEAARTLRALLLDAGRATGQGDHGVAGTCYREARSLCQREGLALEEAMVLMALGGACLAASKTTLAIDAYRRSAELARAIEAWQVTCQAWFGTGGAHLTGERYEAAAIAYRAAADAARQAEIAALGIEALRMEGTCHVLRGVKDEAIGVWQEALDLGLGLDASAREASTLPQVIEALSALLERLGMSAQAAHVRSLLEADRALLEPERQEGTAPLRPPVRSRSSPGEEPALPPSSVPMTAPLPPMIPKGPVLPFQPPQGGVPPLHPLAPPALEPLPSPSSAPVTASLPPIVPASPVLPFRPPSEPPG